MHLACVDDHLRLFKIKGPWNCRSSRRAPKISKKPLTSDPAWPDVLGTRSAIFLGILQSDPGRKPKPETKETSQVSQRAYLVLLSRSWQVLGHGRSLRVFSSTLKLERAVSSDRAQGRIVLYIHYFFVEHDRLMVGKTNLHKELIMVIKKGMSYSPGVMNVPSWGVTR